MLQEKLIQISRTKGTKTIIASSVCASCPIEQNCCYAPLLPLMPEEQRLFKHANTPNQWCEHFDQKSRQCRLGERRPLACKAYVCLWINEKLSNKEKVIL